jgi:phospholipase C
MMMIALRMLAGLPQSAYAQTAAPATTTPIKHVIVIIGENRTFDHVYATYKPKAGQSINNLLSEGIVKANGKPGPNYSHSAQFSAVDNTTAGTGGYSTAPSPRASLARFLQLWLAVLKHKASLVPPPSPR